jgi:hypothetical protein
VGRELYIAKDALGQSSSIECWASSGSRHVFLTSGSDWPIDTRRPLVGQRNPLGPERAGPATPAMTPTPKTHATIVDLTDIPLVFRRSSDSGLTVVARLPFMGRPLLDAVAKGGQPADK